MGREGGSYVRRAPPGSLHDPSRSSLYQVVGEPAGPQLEWWSSEAAGGGAALTSDCDYGRWTRLSCELGPR